MEDGLGVKRAAVRKLGHELGMDAKDLPLSSFTFLTRVHYKAQCPDPKWGEHEVDHILVFRAPADIAVKPNPEEVAEVPTPLCLLGCIVHIAIFIFTIHLYMFVYLYCPLNLHVFGYFIRYAGSAGNAWPKWLAEAQVTICRRGLG